MYIGNNHELFQFSRNENLVKHQKVWKYYENDCGFLKKTLKKYFFEKSIVDQRRNKAVALQYTTLNFIKKAELMQDLFVEALKYIHR